MTTGPTNRPDVRRSSIGQERESLVTIDGFADDPDALRAAAIAAPFAAAGQHYPGVRAPLPLDRAATDGKAVAPHVQRDPVTVHGSLPRSFPDGRLTRHVGVYPNAIGGGRACPIVLKRAAAAAPDACRA